MILTAQYEEIINVMTYELSFPQTLKADHHQQQQQMRNNHLKIFTREAGDM